MKNVIKSSERLDSYILSPTEEFPSNSRWGFFHYLTGMTPVTSTLSLTEEFTSNFWWNFFHYLTGTDTRYLDRYILSPTEEFTSLFWSNFFQYLIGSDPRYLDNFTNRRISFEFSVGFLPLFEWNQSPILRLSSHILVTMLSDPRGQK